MAAAEILPRALWTTSFLKNQGCEVRNAILNQDNMAAMQMEMNGVLSRGKKSRHVDIRFFFIKDRVERGEIDIGFCGTDDMIADYLTKPYKAVSSSVSGMQSLVSAEPPTVKEYVGCL